MNPDRRIDVLAVSLMAVGLAFGLAVWPDLPPRLVVHWSGGGPDTALAKPVALFGIFAIGIVSVVLVRVLPSSMTNTPGGETPSILFLGVVFAWVQGVVVVWNLGNHFSVGLAVVPVLVLAGLLVVYGRIRRPFGL